MELMVDVSRGAESWLPAALADAVYAHRAAVRAPRDPLEPWLRSVRRTTEEYDAQCVRRPPPSPPPRAATPPEPEDALDDILGLLGREIFQLDEYQRRFAPESGDVALAGSILELFDACLDEMTGADLHPPAADSREDTFGTASSSVGDGDAASTLSEDATAPPERFDGDEAAATRDVAGLASCEPTRKTSDANVIFDDGAGEVPVQPRGRRERRGSSSSGSSFGDNVDRGSRKPPPSSAVESLKSRLDSDSDSSSTRWSYRPGSTDSDNGSDRGDYAPVWGCSTGFHNSDDILRRLLERHGGGGESGARDSIDDVALDRLDAEEGCAATPAPRDRRSVPARTAPGARVDMKPLEVEVVADYESVRDARDADDKYASVSAEEPAERFADENIYEEIEYASSCGSVEVVSCDGSASSEERGGEEPLYANLLDNAAYAVGGDVLAWRQRLFHPDYCDDEEDEWISNEESLIYGQEQRRPPFIIPRITSYRACARPPRHRDPTPLSYPEESLAETGLAMKDVRHVFESGRGAVGDWSPLSERGRADIERAFSKASSDSPPLLRLPKRLAGSNENLLSARHPSNHGQHGSGDSLDLELRAQRTHDRRRKSKSMMPSRAGKSPVPAPRAAPAHGEPSDGVVFDSAVRRTKFSENGKKARKNWTDSYLVLTPTHLLFYKDAKAYHAVMKCPGAPPSPSGARGAELALPLQGATVEHCTQHHTSRYTKSVVVTSGGDQLLIQDESTAGAAYWYDIIDGCINRLSGEFLGVVPQLPDAYSTPPVARKHKNGKVGDSSNEDLSDSTEHAKVRNKLRKFFTRRPTMDSLIKKGIYKDEPVFGCNLEEVCPGPEASLRVPDFVVRCVQEIESSESNMHTDGLYRASGNLSQVQKIRLEIDQNNLEILEQNTDVHVLTGSLKLFFRELKEPLIPCKLFNRILSATGIKSREGRLKEFRDIVSNLPQCNWDTLKFLLEHLLRVTEHAAHNRMHIANLAIVFGPTLLWAPAELAHNIAIDCIQQNHAIEILLTDFRHIFSNTRPKKKS